MPFAENNAEVIIVNTGKNADLPLGLGMALMQNADAFIYISALDKTKQAKINEQSKQVKSPSEKNTIVRRRSANR